MIQVAEKPSVRSVLHSSTLLNALTEAQIEELAEVSRLAHAERGDVIWLDGASADFFGLLATGFVKMVKGCANGTDATLELMGPTQIFGLMGVVTGSGCPLSAVAVTDLWYLRIPKRAFLKIYGENLPIRDRLLRRTALRLHGMVDLMAKMSSGKVEERLAAILFILAESYGEREDGLLRLQVPLTRQELGEMAGTTVESTIRVMSRWQKQGIISSDRGTITVLDEPALAMAMKN